MTFNTFNATIFTDEQTELDCTIWYWFSCRPFVTLVANIEFSLSGATQTPNDLIQDQINELIRMRHANEVDFI